MRGTPEIPVVTLPEWGSSDLLCDTPPTPSDLTLASELGEGQQALSVTWLRDGTVRILARSWVGVARFSSFEVRVVPKLAGGNLGVLAMVDYAAGLGHLRQLSVERLLPTGDPHLLDLVCLLLAEEATHVSRYGLLADYRIEEDAIGALRGRLLVREQATRRFGRVDLLECRFDEHDTDVAENQFIALALRRACVACADTDVRRSLRSVSAVFGGACEPIIGDAGWYRQRIVYGRRNARYQPAHEWSELLLRGLGIKDLYGTGTGASFSFLLDMNVIFERFVTRLVTDALEGTPTTVVPQRRTRSVIRDETTGRTYSEIRPDLLIERVTGGVTERLPVDAKYKLYDAAKVSSADVYQAFVYAYAFQDRNAPAKAALVYPAERWATGPRLAVRSLYTGTSAHLIGWGVDIPASLDALRGGTAARRALLERVRGLLTEVEA